MFIADPLPQWACGHIRPRIKQSAVARYPELTSTVRLILNTDRWREQCDEHAQMWIDAPQGSEERHSESKALSTRQRCLLYVWHELTVRAENGDEEAARYVGG